MYATRSSQIVLAFRTNQTAPPKACTLIGAAAMPESDGTRQHTMRAVPTGAGGSAPDVRQGAIGGRRARLDVITSGSGSGRAFPARPKLRGGWIPRISRVTHRIIELIEHYRGENRRKFDVTNKQKPKIDGFELKSAQMHTSLEKQTERNSN